MGYKFIQHLITTDGDLDPDKQEKIDWKEKNPNWIQWVKGNDEICLDGDFTIEELKEIIAFMSGGCIQYGCPFFAAEVEE